MIKNLYLCLKNMLKHLTDKLGDDSLCNYQQYMKLKKRKNNKKKFYMYTWTYNGKQFLQRPSTTNK